MKLLVPSLNIFTTRKPAPIAAYQVNVTDLSRQVDYYHNENNLSLAAFRRENKTIDNLITALPHNVTNANQAETQETIVALNDALLTHQLQAYQKMDDAAKIKERTLALLCIGHLSADSIDKIRKALPYLESMQCNGGALVTLPASLASLKLNHVFLENNLFNHRPDVLKQCKKADGKTALEVFFADNQFCKTNGLTA